MDRFNAAKETKHIIHWIQMMVNDINPKATVVIGISGGKDSTVTAALLAKALGPERVQGVLMPNGTQADLEDAKRVVKHLDIPAVLTNIQKAVKEAENCVANGKDPFTGEPIVTPILKDTKINLPPRIRMSVLYGRAQSFENGGFVVNTCNLSEDFIGYSTKHGDAAGDFAPLAQYTVSEVIEIGLYLGLPEDLVRKTPADGLCGQTDEDKIGFTYAVLDRYIKTGVCEDEDIKRRIDAMHKASAHKRRHMPSCPRLAA